MLEGFNRKVETTRLIEATVVSLKLNDEAVVIGWVYHYSHEAIIFGRCAQHSRAANIDVLDCRWQVAVWIRDGRLEGIEINHHQIDWRNIVFVHNRLVLVAARKDTAVHFGVQRLHAAIHHFGEAGVFRDLDGRNARLLQEAIGAASRKQFDAEVGEGLSEWHEAGFVGDAEQGSADGDRCV